MTHRQAQARVAECGGVATEHVSRQTTMLVVGEEGWPLEPDGTPSVKLQQAERWREVGSDLRIVRESDWLGFVGLDGHRRDVERLYTPAMLSRALDVPVHQIRQWERMGLIRAVSRVFRLPYFDFREVAGVRRLSELVKAGVPAKEIQNGLDRLQRLVGGDERPLVQLEILARDQHVVYRDSQGRLKTVSGQNLLDFERFDAAAPGSDVQPQILSIGERDRAHFTAHDWFEEARRKADDNQIDAAIEACRMSVMQEHDAPEVHFFLAESLYRQGQPRAALERYHVAVELDPEFLEAWTQIGCVLAEEGQLDQAVDAFRIALDVHTDHPDAHLHLAETLHQLGRTAEAVEHWRRYLAFDRRGPWADAARTRLEEAGATLSDEDAEGPAPS